MINLHYFSFRITVPWSEQISKSNGDDDDDDYDSRLDGS